MITLALLIPFVAGLGFVSAMPVIRRITWFETVAYSFLTGQVILALTVFLFTVLSGTIQPVFIGLLLLFSGIILLIWSWCRRLQLSKLSGFKPSALSAVLCAMVIIMLCIAVLQTVSSPITAYDGFAIYAPKSFSFFTERTISAEFLSRDGLPHPDYPLLIPISEAWSAIVMGQWNERLIKVTFPGYLIAMALIFAGFFGRRFGPVAGWGSALLMVCTPQLFTAGTKALCDLPVGVFIFAAVTVFLELGSDDCPCSYLLPGMLLLGACWTKNEGLPLALIVLMVFTARHIKMCGWKDLVRFQSSIYRAWGVVFVGILPWWIMKTHLGLTNEIANERILHWAWWNEHLDRIPILIRYFSSEMIYSSWQHFPWSMWLIGWLMFWSALILWMVYRPLKEAGYIAVVTLLQLLMFLAVFTVTPYELCYQLRTALDRLLMQVFPTAGIFTFLILFSLLKREDQTGEED